MAFGRSGSDTASEMVGADVFVAFWDGNEAKVVDYFLTAKVQVASVSRVILATTCLNEFSWARVECSPKYT